MYKRQDLHTVYRYINTDLLDIFQKHREQSNDEFSNIFEDIKESCGKLDIDIKFPRLARRQTQRFNVHSSSLEDYFRTSIL